MPLLPSSCANAISQQPGCRISLEPRDTFSRAALARRVVAPPPAHPRDASDDSVAATPSCSTAPRPRASAGRLARARSPARYRAHSDIAFRQRARASRSPIAPPPPAAPRRVELARGRRRRSRRTRWRRRLRRSRSGSSADTLANPSAARPEEGVRSSMMRSPFSPSRPTPTGGGLMREQRGVGGRGGARAADVEPAPHLRGRDRHRLRAASSSRVERRGDTLLLSYAFDKKVRSIGLRRCAPRRSTARRRRVHLDGVPTCRRSTRAPLVQSSARTSRTTSRSTPGPGWSKRDRIAAARACPARAAPPDARSGSRLLGRQQRGVGPPVLQRRRRAWTRRRSTRRSAARTDGRAAARRPAGRGDPSGGPATTPRSGVDRKILENLPEELGAPARAASRPRAQLARWRSTSKTPTRRSWG